MTETKKKPKRLPAYETKPVEQLTWQECQRFINVLLRDQKRADKFLLKAYRALEQAMA